MTSLTLHLIVITLLAAVAVTATTTTTTAAATSSTAATGTPTRIVGQRGRGGVASTATTTTTTTTSSSTQAPTLRAPRQRRPPTTLPIDTSSGRRRGSGSFASTTPLPTKAETAATTRPQRRRGTPLTTTTATTPQLNVGNIGGRGSNRGSIRAARQPRDTPTLSVVFAAGRGGGNSSGSGSDSIGSASSRRQSHQSLSSASSNAVDVSASAPSSSSSSFSVRRVAGALKTPRMIQRLVAGHIHNSQGHSKYEVSAVSSNSSSRSSSPTTATTTTTTPTTTATKQARHKASSSYRLGRPSPSLDQTTTRSAYREDDDDEALLNEPDDFDNWDNGILRLSAGSGKESEASGAKGKQGKEDGKKTLSDQVRDGKYGLIEKELFRRVPKRPGVLSYARNSEVPLDNERNFGGLNEQDIWLAEDHLLVIKGGSLNEAENEAVDEAWPAIDDYDAPPRQIKLPPNPVVPPPFPVQLEPHGPLQLIRDNQIESLHSSPGNATFSAEVQHTSYGQVHGSAHGPGSHTAARTGAIASPKAADSEPSYVYPAPYSPWLLYPNETFPPQTPSHPPSSPSPNTLLRTPLLGPWLTNGLNSNGSSSLHSNISDFDEDDPSLYYPPAYSFVYSSNYSNPVPPGPLVPGIVLPPPPDHFSRLEEAVKPKTKTTTTTTRRPSTSTSTSTSTTTSSTTSTTTSTSTARPSSRLSLKYNAIGYLPPSRQPPKYVERVPVPVAVPIPIYPINYQPTTPRPQAQLVFVPSSSTERNNLRERERERDRERDREREREQAPLSKSNPIYYEYFEAKRHKSNVIDDFLATKSPKRQHYKSPPSPVNDVAVVSITPKPRVQLHSEYDAAFGQLIRSNLISPGATGRFQAPDFDRQPFLPMVNYSADEQDQNSFKAIVYQPQRQRQLRVGKHQQLQLEPTMEPVEDQDSYLPYQRQLRVGKQQSQSQSQSQPQSSSPYDTSQGIYSTPLPPSYLDNQLQPRPVKYQLRPPAPAQLQFWQRPASAPLPPQQVAPLAPQFKRLRHNSAKHPHSHSHPYPPYFVPSYPSAPGPEPLYRLLPVPQHKNWRQGGNTNKQSQQIQVQPHQQQQQYYPDRNVNIGHSLASDILVNYNTNNQFNSQAELVPQAQLGPPPLSYQAQNGGQASLWSDRPVRQSRAQLQEQN